MLLLFLATYSCAAFAASTDAAIGTSATDEGEGGGGANPWQNPSYAASDQDGGLSATSSITSDGSSNILLFSDFNIDVPTNAPIEGIQVKIEGTSTAISNLSAEVQLYWNDELQGTSKLQDFLSGTTSHFFGGSQDVWGASPTQSIVEDAGFGFRVIFFNDISNTTESVSVDYATITVYYTAPPTVTLADGTFECSTSCPPNLEYCTDTGRANANGTYDIDITFSEAVTGFASGDITVTNGSVQGLTGNGASYTATLTSACTNCIVTVTIAADGATSIVTSMGNVAGGPLTIPWGQEYQGTCDFGCRGIDLPYGYSLVLQSNESTAVDFGSNAVVNARLRKGTSRIADFRLATGGTYMCDFLYGQIDQQSFFAFDDPLNLFHTPQATFTLYVPYNEAHNAVRVCLDKTTLGCSSSDTWSFVGLSTNEFATTNVDPTSLTNIDVSIEQSYWKITGLDGTGGQGENYEGDGSNPVPFFPLWSIPVIGFIGWYVLKREGWIQA